MWSILGETIFPPRKATSAGVAVRDLRSHDYSDDNQRRIGELNGIPSVQRHQQTRRGHWAAEFWDLSSEHVVVGTREIRSVAGRACLPLQTDQLTSPQKHAEGRTKHARICQESAMQHATTAVGPSCAARIPCQASALESFLRGRILETTQNLPSRCSRTLRIVRDQQHARTASHRQWTKPALKLFQSYRPARPVAHCDRRGPDGSQAEPVRVTSVSPPHEFR